MKFFSRFEKTVLGNIANKYLIKLDKNYENFLFKRSIF